MYKDKKLDTQSQRKTDAISYIMAALRGHQPQIFECSNTGNYYLLLPENMLQKLKVATHSLSKKEAKVKLINKHNKRYTKVMSRSILQLKDIVEEVRKKKKS